VYGVMECNLRYGRPKYRCARRELPSEMDFDAKHRTRHTTTVNHHDECEMRMVCNDIAVMKTMDSIVGPMSKRTEAVSIVCCLVLGQSRGVFLAWSAWREMITSDRNVQCVGCKMY
jgi:hypothetical protein